MVKSLAAILFIIVFSMSSSLSFGQFQGKIYEQDASVKVFEGNQERTLAWCGGFNAPQFAMGDLNHDNLIDLVSWEVGAREVKPFLNVGTPGNPVYRYAPQLAHNFPLINYFMKLEDYNCDNIPDLIQGSSGRSTIAVWKGRYNAQNELTFDFYKELFYEFNGGLVNAYYSTADIPGVADIDHDGDLDFLSYDNAGFLIAFYKNCRVEENLPCDSIKICLSTTCWGKSIQGFNRAQQLHYSCVQEDKNETTCRTTMHTGNTVCLLDMDNDGDYDYLNGNVSFSDMQYLHNGKTEYNSPVDSMISQDTMWQSNGVAISSLTWPAAFWLDYDQDGKKDILVAPHVGAGAENYKCIAYYKNTGTVNTPQYTYQGDTLLIENTIDLGTTSYPVFYDYNKDGKPDLFIGSEGYYQSNGTFRSRISYYENTSTPGNPSLTFQTADFLGMDSLNFVGTAPAFGDLNNDGITDMVIGHKDGTLSFYKNYAANDSVLPDWRFETRSIKDSAAQNIDIGNSAVPLFYDMNKDSLPDLIIGRLSGTLTYYKNNSQGTGQIRLQKITDNLGNVKVDPSDCCSGASTPFIGKMDNTGKEYLVLGSHTGAIYRYDNFQNGNVSGSFTLLDTAYSDITNAGYQTMPAIADVDGDGKYEMMIGNSIGGLSLYRQAKEVGIYTVTKPNTGFENCLVYPNPAKDQLMITWKNAMQSPVSVQLYNMNGQRMIDMTVPANQTSAEMSLKNFPSGVYCCILRCEGKQFVSSVTVIK